MSSQHSPESFDKNGRKTFSTFSAYSSTTKNKTVTRNGQPEETASESVEASTTSSNGEPIQFDDNFEELKRSILNGDAYKRSNLVHKETTPRQGQRHYKPQEGVTTIRPTRANLSNAASPTTTAPDQTKLPNGRNSGKETKPVTSPKMSNYKTELYIPIRRHHGDFDDFFKSRWLEHNSSLMDTEFDRRRTDWESRLEDMKRDFFHFSPFSSDRHPHIESSNTIQPFHPQNFFDHNFFNTIENFTTNELRNSGPSGNPEFAVRFDVKDFKPEEINVSTKAGKLTITAFHEEKSGNSTSRREFKRTVDVPSDVQVELMRSTLSKDGVLVITAPIKPPSYLPGAPAVPAIHSSSQVTQQHAKALSTMPTPPSSILTRSSESGDALNYSLSIVGYQPEEVNVTVEGRKVTIHAKHEESTGGRKVHNQMTKSFDLPSSVDPNHVRSYIKDGTTLFIEAHLRDDLAGKIHLVPVTHK